MATTTRLRTVGDVLSEIPELSTFNQLVRRSGVIVDLDGAGPFTVLAPTNDAFGRLPENALGNIVKHRARLKDFVRHHIVVGLFDKERISASTVVPSLLGVGISVINVEPGPYVGGARMVDPNLEAGNGVVHTFDAVMMPG